jgi:hypothetical protein
MAVNLEGDVVRHRGWILKLPAFQFYPGDWMKDPDLRRCSHAARGVWIDMLCLMFECSDRGVLASGGNPWSREDVAAAVGGNGDVTLRCIDELVAKGVAKVRDDGAIYSARMVKDEVERGKTRERVQNHREKQKTPPLREGNAKCSGDVTHLLHPSSSSTSSSTSVDTPPNPPGGESVSVEGGALGIGGAALGIERRREQGPRFTEEMVRALYAAYPRRESQGSAFRKIREALVAVGDDPGIADPFGWLLSRVKAYAASPVGRDMQFVPKPEKWFDEEKYRDDPATWGIDRSATANRQTAPVKKENPMRARLSAEKGISQ